jgi:cystathionine beta-lyase
LTAASKTFNLAGLQLANTIIRNSQLRQSFDHQLRMTAGLDSPSVFGLVACQAAYQYGANWLDRLLKHLLNNFQELGQTIDQVFRLVSGSVQADRGQTVLPPEGTYLAWLDLRQLGLEHERLVRWLEDEAGLWLSNGLDYGQAGAGFMRWNVAQPQTVMRQALAQLLNAAQGLAA